MKIQISRTGGLEIAKWAIFAGLLAWIFFPTFVWMVERWSAHDSYFTHGFLIPPLVAYWIWQKRADLASAKLSTGYAGLVILAAGVMIQIAASVLRIYFVSGFAFVVCLFGLIYFLYGRNVIRHIWFPVLFLFFMVPLPLLVISEVTLKMKFFVTELASSCLNSVGIAAERNGSYLALPHSVLLIGDPCSGLRSFLSFLCLGFVFAYMGRTPLWGRAVLVVAGLPLAILSNLLRVFSLGLVAEIYGQETADGTFHDVAGIVVFIIALTVFMMIRQKLEEVGHVRSA